MESPSILIKGEHIDLDRIPNPRIREILENAAKKNIRIEEEKDKESYISFNWHDWVDKAK